MGCRGSSKELSVLRKETQNPGSTKMKGMSNLNQTSKRDASGPGHNSVKEVFQHHLSCQAAPSAWQITALLAHDKAFEREERH